MKSLFGLVIAALAALGIVAAAFVLLSQNCRPVPPAPRPNVTVPMSFDQRADVPQVLPFEPDVFRAVFADLRLVQAAPAPVQQTWHRDFFCDIRITDVMLAIFALFLVIATGFQGIWLRSALRATEKSAHIIDAAMISTQRAYVVFKEFRVGITKLSAIEDIQSATIQPIWENAGTTPTRNGRGHVNWRYFERAIPNDFELADFDEVGNRIESYANYLPLVIGPKGTAFSPVILLEGSTLRMVRDLQGRVLIWGWAEYDDVFDVAHRHRTEFCYQLVVTGSPASTQIGFSQYRRYNGVDADCERKPTAVTTA